MKPPFKWIFFLACLLAVSDGLLYAEFAQDLQKQVDKISKEKQLGPDYFRDMGIVARKADEAWFPDLTVEIIRKHLFPQMKQYAVELAADIVMGYGTDKAAASRKLADLGKMDRLYQPSPNFLESAFGQAISGELSQLRIRTLEAIQKDCSEENLLQAVQAVKLTGLFLTNTSAEIDALRKLTESIQCCAGWKPEIVFTRDQEFESEYEMGTISETGRLRLESSRTDLSEARWVGEWIYKYTGREGRGEGVSQAVLVYHKGDEQVPLTITGSRVSSVGRMNFPNALSGEQRTLEVKGTALHPELDYFGEALEITGCKADQK